MAATFVCSVSECHHHPPLPPPTGLFSHPQKKVICLSIPPFFSSYNKNLNLFFCVCLVWVCVAAVKSWSWSWCVSALSGQSGADRSISDMFPVKAASTGSLSLMNTHITPSFPILFSTEELKRDCNPATKFDAVAVEKNGRMNSVSNFKIWRPRLPSKTSNFFKCSFLFYFMQV